MAQTPAQDNHEDSTSWIASLRFRVFAALVLATLLSLLVAGTVTYSLERGRLDADIDAHLRQRHAEVTALAARGNDPFTGQPITDVTSLLRASMQTVLPGPNDGEIGIVDGVVTLTAPSSTRVRPENNTALVRLVTSPGDRALIDTTTGTDGTYRYIIVPVSVPGDARTASLVAVVDLGAERTRLNANFRTFTLVGLGSSLLVGLLAWLILGHLLQPIEWVRRTAQEITDRDLSRRIPVRGRDDLAALTRTVNAMLDRLQSTFASQRQLQDDVSHELRTPLTVMRGHLELMDETDPDDVDQARAVALSEIDRMAGLVEDLITLAKSDRPDFVQPVTVDVAMLTDEVLDKATALGDRRWSLDGLADVEAVLDPRRVSQALLELARNAVKFSEPDSAVAVGSAVVGDRVLLWVRDEGRGIEPDRLHEVTQRFSRIHHDVEGSGLGLTIVTSIARAHGGSLRVDSHPGEGSTFTLDLPLSGAHD
ncbi:sensor histidine kinase [Mariniluteicoccus flavus]